MGTHREVTFDEYVALLRRNVRLLIVLAILGGGVGFVLAKFVPPSYTSHTMVLVEEPVVPDSYVKPVVSEDVNQRLASMQGQILSRTRLEQLVEKFNPYKKDTGRVPEEVMIERLKKSIKVAPLNPMPGTLSRELPGFTVDVTLSEPLLAQQVCTEIVSMFMNQNIHLRQRQAEDTTKFLGKRLEDAKSKLDEQDAKLAAFQTRHTGALPEDEKTNLTLLAGITPQLEAVTQGLNQARQEKTFVQSLLNQQVAELKATGSGENPKTLGQQLGDLQNQLALLQRDYTDKHPKVIKLKQEIAQLQSQILQEPAKEPSAVGELTQKAFVPDTPQIQQLRAQLHQFDLTISQKAKEQEDLQRQIRLLQGRIELSPVIQQELKAITRDYQTALDFYNDLLKKRNESEMATKLEDQQQSEKFRMLDPPSLPVRASFPDPKLFVLGGLCAGPGLGAALLYFSWAHDKSIRTRRDVEVYLGVPTLAVVSRSGSTKKIRSWTEGNTAVKRA